jgi:hypothetical protein
MYAIQIKHATHMHTCTQTYTKSFQTETHKHRCGQSQRCKHSGQVGIDTPFKLKMQNSGFRFFVRMAWDPSLAPYVLTVDVTITTQTKEALTS